MLCAPDAFCILHSVGRPILRRPKMSDLIHPCSLQSVLGLCSVDRSNKTKFFAISGKTRHFVSKSKDFDLFSPMS